MAFSLLIIGIIPVVYLVSIESGIASADSETSLPDSVLFDRFVENNAFGIDEKLNFEINYGFINAGTATMHVHQLIEYENRPCFQIVTTANSNNFFSSFYKVEDKVETIVDAIGIFSWRFEKNLKEGSYQDNRLCVFDQRQNVVYYKNDTVEVQRYVQDALSSLYFIRTQTLEPGKSFFIENFTDGKKYSLEVKVIKKEKITVEAGTFNCIIVEPLLQTVGVFKHEGKLKVWLTDDRLKMPVLMKSKVLVGSISAELVNYQLGEIENF